MHLLASSLALLLLASAVDLVQSANCYNEIANCYRGNGDVCQRPPAARECCSRRLTRCGDCIVCVKYLEKGDHCGGYVPNNAICRPPLRCGPRLMCV